MSPGLLSHSGDAAPDGDDMRVLHGVRRAIYEYGRKQEELMRKNQCFLTKIRQQPGHHPQSSPSPDGVDRRWRSDLWVARSSWAVWIWYPSQGQEGSRLPSLGAGRQASASDNRSYCRTVIVKKKRVARYLGDVPKVEVEIQPWADPRQISRMAGLPSGFQV